MIKFKLEKNKRGDIVFKLKLEDEDLKKFSFMNRVVMESIKLKGEFNYKVPMRFFGPIFNNLDKKILSIDEESICSYIEFSDEYDEECVYVYEANARVMMKWRKAGCPNIYESNIDKDKKEINSRVIFQKNKITLNEYNVKELLV